MHLPYYKPWTPWIEAERGRNCHTCVFGNVKALHDGKTGRNYVACPYDGVNLPLCTTAKNVPRSERSVLTTA